MPNYGLGSYQYELEVKNGSANFTFWDADDADNTATVSVAKEDFPVKDADSRQVADLAFSKVAERLDKKRDERIQKEEADRLAEKQEQAAVARAAAVELYEFVS